MCDMFDNSGNDQTLLAFAWGGDNFNPQNC